MRTTHFPLAWCVILGVVLLLMTACAAPASSPAPVSTEPPLATSAATEASQATQPAALPTQPPAIPEARHLTLEWPPDIRVGDSDVIRLTLEVDAQGNLTPTAQVKGHDTRGGTVFIPNLYETHYVFVEARLDLVGVEVSPTDEKSEPLLPGQSVTFIWSVRPHEIGTYRGTIQVHLRFVPIGGGAESRTQLSSQLVEVRAVNFLGLGGVAARLVGVLGTVLGSLITLDNLIDLLVKGLKALKKRG